MKPQWILIAAFGEHPHPVFSKQIVGEQEVSDMIANFKPIPIECEGSKACIGTITKLVRRRQGLFGKATLNKNGVDLLREHGVGGCGPNWSFQSKDRSLLGIHPQKLLTVSFQKKAPKNGEYISNKLPHAWEKLKRGEKRQNKN